MKRPFLLPVLSALAALLLASCSQSVLSRPDRSPLAARVDGVEITQEELLDEANLVDELSGSSLASQFPTAGEGTYSTELLAAILTDRIQRAVLGEVLVEQDVEVTDAHREQARLALVQQLGVDPTTGQPDPALGEARLAEVPKDYAARLLRDLAGQLALIETLTESPEVTDEDVDAFYAENAEALAEACAAHILISTEERTPEEAEALAEDLAAQLDAGADFAELAAENSDDPGSGSAGGELGCAPRGSYVDAFDEAVWSQPIGEVGDPVETEFGVHLVLVSERKESLEELRDDIRAGLEQQAVQQTQVAAQEEVQGLLLAALADADIEVDARYGTWDPVSGGVLPPEGPTPLPTSTIPGALEIPTDGLQPAPG